MKTNFLSVRLTETQQDALRELAAEKGLTVSQFIRIMIRNALQKGAK